MPFTLHIKPHLVSPPSNRPSRDPTTFARSIPVNCPLVNPQGKRFPACRISHMLCDVWDHSPVCGYLRPPISGAGKPLTAVPPVLLLVIIHADTAPDHRWIFLACVPTTLVFSLPLLPDSPCNSISTIHLQDPMAHNHSCLHFLPTPPVDRSLPPIHSIQ